mgnify:CR=1 FL=1
MQSLSGHKNSKETSREKQYTLKIYTKRGDGGETSLCNGSRTFKDSLRVEAYGSVDEVSSYIGLAIVKTSQADLKHHLMEIQKDLFSVGSNLALPGILAQSQIGKTSPIEQKIPKIGLIELEDLETGGRCLVDTTDEAWQQEFHRQTKKASYKVNTV